LKRLIALLIGSGLLMGCSSYPEPASSRHSTGEPVLQDLAVPPPGSCHLTGGPEPASARPDPQCTPGAVNPEVTQSDIDSTICQKGWTKTVRPPATVTSPLKRQLMLAYAEAVPTQEVELDHLLPLELGGAPLDVHNLWPEPGASPNPKDKVESQLNHLVCSRRLGLGEAQQRIQHDWTTAATGLPQA